MSAGGALEPVTSTSPGALGGGSLTLQALNEALAAAWAEPTATDAPMAPPAGGDTQASSPGVLAPRAAAPDTLLHSAGTPHTGLASAHGLHSPAPDALTAGLLATTGASVSGSSASPTDLRDTHSLPVHPSALQLGAGVGAAPWPAPCTPDGPATRPEWPPHPGDETDQDHDGRDAHGDGTADLQTPPPPIEADDGALQAWLQRLRQAGQTTALAEQARGRAVLLVGAGRAWCLGPGGVATFSCQSGGSPLRAWQGWRLFRGPGNGPKGGPGGAPAHWRARQPTGDVWLHLGTTPRTTGAGHRFGVAEGQRLLHHLGRQWSLWLLVLPEATLAPAMNMTTEMSAHHDAGHDRPLSERH